VVWRHGRTLWNAEKRFQGQTDVALDEVGVAQAGQAAQVLAGLSPDRIVSSDLSRARATAQALADLTGLDVTTDPGLRETHAGQWEGLTRDEIEARFPGAMERWSADSDERPGGGEDRREVSARAVAAIERALTGIGPDGTLVVATHSGSARAAIGALLGLPPEHWAALGVLANCAWSVLEESSGPHGPRWRLAEYNAGSLPVTALADDH
jgi:broad specificity phosphatase PhoE